MKKSGLAAVALIGAATLTGSAVVPGSAVTTAAKMHTMKLVLHNLTERPVGKYGNVGTDLIKSNGKFVGYDSYTGRIPANPRNQTARVAFALKGGIILGFLSLHKDGIYGPIEGGSGKYKGIQGKVTLRESTRGELVTLRYHF